MKVFFAIILLCLVIISVGAALTYHSINVTMPKVEKTKYTYVKTFPGEVIKTYTKTDYVVVEQNWRPYYPIITSIGVIFIGIGVFFLTVIIITILLPTRQES